MPSVNLPAGDATHRPTNRARPTNRLMTFREWCKRCGFSTVTGWRIMKAGDGPKVTRISPRRIGIREDHHAEWLDSREIR
jgi:predicted DNA-binding transcriptional regulator AlpA